VWVFPAEVGLAVEGGGEDVAAAVVGVQGVREGEVAFADEEDAVVRVEGDGWALVLLLVVRGLVLVLVSVGFGLGVSLGSGEDFAFLGYGLRFGSHRWLGRMRVGGAGREGKWVGGGGIIDGLGGRS